MPVTNLSNAACNKKTTYSAKHVFSSSELSYSGGVVVPGTGCDSTTTNNYYSKASKDHRFMQSASNGSFCVYATPERSCIIGS